jgi:serine/threonine protein kinase
MSSQSSMEEDPFEFTMPTAGGKSGEPSNRETKAPTSPSAPLATARPRPVKLESASPTPSDSRHYKVGREIAKGGMGRILEAEDTGLHRTVAMKVMLGNDASGEAQQRFTREAEVLARLEHPNIVPIHELGRDERGQAFYTMKMVKGQTLQQIIDSLRADDADTLADYTLDRLLAVSRKICDAIAFAHYHQVIHRDLKPDNIMVGEFGEVLVMDWGLAKILTEEAGKFQSEAKQTAPVDLTAVLDGSTDLTLDGEFIGTPRYMPPEQAGGTVEDIDKRSDVFALGGILYAILTLNPPIRGNSLEELLDNLKSGNITAPTEFGSTARMAVRAPESSGAAPTELPGLTLNHCPDGKVPPSMSAVAMRALAVDKEDRYQAVGELADDIDRFKGGFATSVETLSAFGQALLFVRRHRAVSTAVFTAMVLVSAITAVFMNRLMASNQETAAKAEEATQNATQAVENATRAQENAARAEANASRANSESERAQAEATTAKAVSDFLIGMFEDADPIARHGRTMGARGRVGPDLTAREIMGYGIKSLEGSLTNSPMIRAGLLDKIGNVCLSLGLYSEAAPLIEEAFAIRVASHGMEHVDVAASLRALGIAHFYRGEHDQAEVRLANSLQILEKLHGTNHPIVSDVALDLGVVTFVNHNGSVAQPLMARSLAIRQEVYGKASREALAAMLFLAVLENTGGRSNPSRVTDLAKLWDTSSGTAEFGRFINLSLEAKLAAKFDRQAALNSYNEAHRIGTKLLGEKHLMISFFRGHHATILSNLGRKKEAVTMLQSALANVTESQGENFILAGNLAFTLGTVAIMAGEPEASEKAFTRAIQVFAKQLKTNDDELYQRQYRQAIQRFSGMLAKQGKYQVAATTLDPLVDRYGEELEKHPEIAQRYAFLLLHAKQPQLINKELSEKFIGRNQETAFKGAIQYAKAAKLMEDNYNRALIANALRKRFQRYLATAISMGYDNLV